MNRCLWIMVLCGAFAAVGYAEPLRPNIVIIFTDDQGYADFACYGNEKNKTPRMDKLAAEGTRFTSFSPRPSAGRRVRRC